MNLKQAFEYISLNVVDDKTIIFNLPEQNTFFPSLLTQPILPRSHLEDALLEELIDPDLDFNQHPIGAGPFRFKNIIPDRSGHFRVFLEKNPYYYAGEPLLEQLVLYVYPNLESLKTNHPWPTAFSRIDYREQEDFNQTLYNEYITQDYLLPRFTGVFFNLDKPIVRNPYFRKALVYGVDFKNLLEKGWVQTQSPLFFEGVETNYFVTDFVESRRILRDNGFPYNKLKESRTSGKAGEVIDLKMITSVAPPVYSRFAQNMVRIWSEELDINIDLEILDPLEFNQRLKVRDYDMVLFGQNFSNNFDMLSLWHSSQSGKLNLSNMTREDIDFLIDEIRFSGAKSDFFELGQSLDELLPALVFGTPQYSLLYSKRIHSFSDTFGKIRNLSDRFFGVEIWHFNKAKDWDIPHGEFKWFLFIKWIFGADEKN